MTEDPAELAALREELESVFAERTRDEWEAKLGDVEAMVAPVQTANESLTSDRAAARGLVERDGGGARVGFPALASESPADAAGPAPAHGEHTDAVLREAGYDEETRTDLREAGVIQ